tara:strand:- start:480 stop:908 length:429 start_codon:yes stop_codon:yes gene_type:complete
MPLIATIFGFLGTGIKSLFGFKEAQANVVNKTLDIVKSIDDNDATRVTATANSLNAILTQGSWLEKNWRAFLMASLVLVIISSWFGYIPPHLNDLMSPNMQEYYKLLEIGLGGYIAKNGIVEIVKMFNISSIVKEIVKKKVL